LHHFSDYSGVFSERTDVMVNRPEQYVHAKFTDLTKYILWKAITLDTTFINITPFSSLAVLDPSVGHTMDVPSAFISVLCHSD